jgi:hypothetical protein
VSGPPGCARKFRERADELAAEAKEKNLDGATLAFVKLTMNWVIGRAQ